ncbi:MAG: PD-(D/E)XK nuclease family protein [Bacteroidales bacterium]|nr:PD-(D/E)XK nuclease family protein [Bacteroidales bacterium]
MMAQNEAVATQDTLVAVPNKRAKRMIQLELAKQLQKTFFSPAIFSIDEFVHELSPYKNLSDIELQIELYNLCRKQNFPRCADFIQFLSWAPAFLSDINEIDMQLTDPQAIFTNILQIKEIEEAFQDSKAEKTTPETSRKSEYLRFYEALYPLYQAFNQQLMEKGCGYNGAIYRDEAAHVATYASALPYKRYIFAGFNTLSPAEIAIVKWLHQHCNAELYFDLDRFYERHFLDKFIKPIQNELNLSEIETIGNDYGTISKQIRLTGVSKTTTQLLCAIEKLHAIERKQGHLNDTVLVLADEKMVLPFVHLYDHTNANLTMGYPFAATPAATLFNGWFDLYINALQFMSEQRSDTTLFSAKELFSFLRNPILQEIIGNTTSDGFAAIEKLQHRRLLFVSLPEIEKVIAEWLPAVTEKPPVLPQFINFALKLLNSIDKASPHSATVQLLLKDVQKLALQLSNSRIDSDIRTACYLVKQLMSSLTIPFKGDFAHGLQVMGVLETRMLDFKNVIVVGLNEGVLPKRKSHNTLLLYDVKQHFGSPSEQHKESVFACHFFHLLQRAEDITLIYDTDSEGTLAEPSRFISQLQYEVKVRGLQDRIEITEEHLSILPKLNNSNSRIQIIKNKRIMEKIRNISFSASALNCYMLCPLKFYLQYVEKLVQAQAVVEPLQANIIGSVFHRILEKVLNGYLAACNRSAYIQDFTNNLTLHIAQAMNSQPELSEADFSRGKYYMAGQILDKMIRNYLKCIPAELSRARIIGVEIGLNHTLPVNGGSVHLKGIADRVEEENGTLAVLDYKTGRTDAGELKYSSMETLFSDIKQAKLFQLLFYLFLYQKDKSEATAFKTAQVKAGIVCVREAVSGNSRYIKMASSFPNSDSTLITKELLSEFETCLIRLINHILDTGIPFVQTDREEHCQYCDFSMICVSSSLSTS